MATQAATGFGTLLKAGDGVGPETFTTILENISLAGPPLTRETVDATNHESPDGYREFLPSLADGGEVSGEGNLIMDTTQTNLLTDHQNGTLRNFELLVPLKGGSKKWSFAAYVTQFEASYPIDDKMTYAFSLKVTGKPTLT